MVKNTVFIIIYIFLKALYWISMGKLAEVLQAESPGSFDVAKALG